MAPVHVDFGATLIGRVIALAIVAIVLCQCGAVPPPGAALTPTAAPGVVAPAVPTAATTGPVVCMTPTPPFGPPLVHGSVVIKDYHKDSDIVAGRLEVSFYGGTSARIRDAVHAQAAKRGAPPAIVVERNEGPIPFDVVDVSCASSLEGAMAVYREDKRVLEVNYDGLTRPF